VILPRALRIPREFFELYATVGWNGGKAARRTGKPEDLPWPREEEQETAGYPRGRMSMDGNPCGEALCALARIFYLSDG